MFLQLLIKFSMAFHFFFKWSLASPLRLLTTIFYLGEKVWQYLLSLVKELKATKKNVGWFCSLKTLRQTALANIVSNAKREKAVWVDYATNCQLRQKLETWANVVCMFERISNWMSYICVTVSTEATESPKTSSIASTEGDYNVFFHQPCL